MINWTTASTKGLWITLALKHCSALREKVSLGRPDLCHQRLQKWTSVEKEKGFYPSHQVSQLRNKPGPLCGCAADLSAHPAACSSVQWAAVMCWWGSRAAGRLWAVREVFVEARKIHNIKANRQAWEISPHISSSGRNEHPAEAIPASWNL